MDSRPRFRFSEVNFGVNLPQAKLNEEMRQAQMNRDLLEKKAKDNEALIKELKVLFRFCLIKFERRTQRNAPINFESMRGKSNKKSLRKKKRMLGNAPMRKRQENTKLKC